MHAAILPSQWERLTWLWDKSHQFMDWARIFQMCREFLGDKFQLVWTLEEAYDKVGARPEDFSANASTPKTSPPEPTPIQPVERPVPMHPKCVEEWNQPWAQPMATAKGSQGGAARSSTPPQK